MYDLTKTTECCPGKETVTRTILPSIAISRDSVYTLPLSVAMSKQHAVDFKCYQLVKVGPHAEVYDHRIKFKAGLVRSENPVVRAAQAVAGATIPGNLSSLRSPGRSAMWSALTPGGASPIPRAGTNSLARAAAAAFPKPDRGFRCPEGFQFGGQFTDKYFSTCGKKLFALAVSLLTGGAQQIGLRSPRLTRELNISGIPLVPIGNPGQVSITRSPDIEIPKVGSKNFGSYKQAIKNVASEMTESAKPVARLVRRDGVVLTPLVSPSVLRTVPDNRNMEDAAYVSYVVKPTQIGGQELGMFSNSGINTLVYVLPNGGTLTLRKTRNLSNGERRKLGKLVAEAERMQNGSDAAARIEHIVAEMDGPIAYEQSFGDLRGPNDMITIIDPKTKRQRQMRRWYRDAFMLDRAPSQTFSRTTQIEDEAGMVEDLRSAIGMLNQGGQIGNISPELRIPAMDMSRVAESRRLNNRTTSYRIRDETLIAVTPTVANEHIGVMVAAEVQSQLGALSPEVWFAGSGSRRPYIISYPDDSESLGRFARSTGMDLADPEDMVRLMIADVLTDVRDRNPSNLFTVGDTSRKRTFAGPVASSGGAGLTRDELAKRVDAPKLVVLNEIENSMYRDFFMRLRKEQRRRAEALLEEMLERARRFDMGEFFRRMAIDGKLSESERRHMEIVRAIYENRVRLLSGSLKFVRNVINGI